VATGWQHWQRTAGSFGMWFTYILHQVMALRLVSPEMKQKIVFGCPYGNEMAKVAIVSETKVSTQFDHRLLLDCVGRLYRERGLPFKQCV
jgi:hypothetical protein